MEFNTHFDLSGKHAFLSGSNYHWINYTSLISWNKFMQTFEEERRRYSTPSWFINGTTQESIEYVCQ